MRGFWVWVCRIYKIEIGYIEGGMVINLYVVSMCFDVLD